MKGPLVDEVARQYLVAHPGESSRVLEAQPTRDAAAILASVDPTVAEQVMRRMQAASAAPVLADMTGKSATALMQESDFVLVARWLEYLDPATSERLLQSLPTSFAKNVREALDFPEGTAGRLMDPRVLSFAEDVTVDQVLRRIRQVKNRRISDVLLVDSDGRLTGKVALQNLLGTEGTAAVGEVAERGPAFVTPMAGKDEVVELLTAGNLASLPVVSVDGSLLGVLRHDALIQAAQDQVSADALQMVGAAKEERALSSPGFAVKSRLPWLLINLVTAFVAAAVVGLFDTTIARFTALAVLMPVVAGQSGNTGAQALAVTSRGLALREIRIGHWLRVVGKEAIASVINGVSVAVVTCGGVYLWSGNVGLTIVIGVSMVASMLVAAVSGAVIPIILTALDRDPATASSIVLTTVTDVAGFFSFLGLATLLSDLLV